MPGIMPPGTEPVAEERTHWVIYDDGSTGRLTATSEELPPLAKPGKFVTEAKYLRRHKELSDAHATYVAGLVAEDEERTRGDYEALTAVGVPEATARRLTGHVMAES